MKILILFLVSINLLMTRFALLRLHQPTTLALWAIKVFIAALSPILCLIGTIGAIFGFALHSSSIIAIGISSALLFLINIIKITRAPDASTGFEQAFGIAWEDRIPKERKVKFLPKRYVFKLPNTPDPIFDQNIAFYTIPDTNRQLLCDIWQPSKNTLHSGMAFIYLHGSAWAVLDKDFGTRPLFRHLVNQGHVVMDVAYRLFPETGFMGMVHDAKHAIAWMKANAATYGVNPNNIIIGGGSAGAHIALLAAYTDKNSQLTPSDLTDADTSVQCVVSLYGQSDLAATYYHTCQHLTSSSALGQKKEGEPGGMPPWVQKYMGMDLHRLGFDKEVEPGMLSPMLGGNPDEIAADYARFSPITYIQKGCPATLILHGEQDILAPVEAIHRMHDRLKAEGVPVVMHILPHTDHAFDIILPKISPSAHNAIYDVERFLAVLVGKGTEFLTKYS